MTARTMKTPRQEVKRSNNPPKRGARIGARPFTSMSSEKNRALAAWDAMNKLLVHQRAVIRVKGAHDAVKAFLVAVSVEAANRAGDVGSRPGLM